MCLRHNLNIKIVQIGKLIYTEFLVSKFAALIVRTLGTCPRPALVWTGGGLIAKILLRYACSHDKLFSFRGMFFFTFKGEPAARPPKYTRTKINPH